MTQTVRIAAKSKYIARQTQADCQYLGKVKSSLHTQTHHTH